MNVAAFVVIAFMLTGYVLLDGFDLGVAAVGPLLARTDRERAAIMASIGPFWNGNEVWLIGAGGLLFALFPAAYAAAFSGFYLPFIVVLWLLMFRGLAVELRNRLPSEIWHQFWDAAFWGASTLLIFLFGIALGNLLRGVPLGAAGYFEGRFAFLLNPYALFVGLFAVVTLAVHGAAFAAARIEGELGERALQAARAGSWLVLALYVVVTAMTFFAGVPIRTTWVFAMPLLTLAALAALWWSARRERCASGFASSSALVATLLITAAGTLFPYLLPGFPTGRGGISIYEAAPSRAALGCALSVAIAGIVLVALYGPILWRRMAGKIRVE